MDRVKWIKDLLELRLKVTVVSARSGVGDDGLLSQVNTFFGFPIVNVNEHIYSLDISFE